MKKAIAIMTVALMAVIMSAACGAGGAGGGMSGGSAAPQAPMSSSAPLRDEMSLNLYSSGADGRWDWDDEQDYAYELAATVVADSAPQAPMGSTRPGAAANTPGGEISAEPTSGSGGGLAEKIIYTAHAEIETVEFDNTIEAVHGLRARYGAFIENSYVGGRNYAQSRFGHQSYRSARFTLRVPQDQLASMTELLDSLGNVTFIQNDAQNITAQFFDTQSRLTALRTQEQSLLNMLAKAETVADMIIIEERLSDVRYNIESLTSTLRNWQNQIDYSTLTLNIQEVEVFTEIVPIHRTYWQQIGDGLQNTVRGVGRFFMGLFMWIIVNLPVFIILAIIAAAVTFIVRSKIRKLKKKNEPAEGDDEDL